MDNALHAPTKIPKKIVDTQQDAAPAPSISTAVTSMGMSGGSTGGVPGGTGLPGGTGPVVSVKPPPPPEKPKGPAHISGGVIAGNLLEKTQPSYPPIAKAAHVQGAVVLHAIISKNGSIQNLTVISGNEMLRSSALDAVRSWKYKPYLLNGDPTEVDTTVTVNFTLGG